MFNVKVCAACSGTEDTCEGANRRVNSHAESDYMLGNAEPFYSKI